MRIELTPHIRAAFHIVEAAIATALNEDAQAFLIADEPLPNGWRYIMHADGMRDDAPSVYVDLHYDINHIGVEAWYQSADEIYPVIIALGRLNHRKALDILTPDEDMRAAILPLIAADLVG